MAEKFRDIIVLIPGITGSVLAKDGKAVWGPTGRVITRALFSGGGSLHRDLFLPADAPYDLGDGVEATSLVPDLHLIPGFWKIDGYGKIAQFLQSTFDLTEGESFFRFPYDWRRDNRVAARRLSRLAERWLGAFREKSPEARLILVCHSMGGLVARYFLEVLEGWRMTRALITFGTPFRGSPAALNSLANGVRKGPMDISWLTRSFTSV